MKYLKMIPLNSGLSLIGAGPIIVRGVKAKSSIELILKTGLNSAITDLWSKILPTLINPIENKIFYTISGIYDGEIDEEFEVSIQFYAKRLD